VIEIKENWGLEYKTLADPYLISPATWKSIK
jgi:hypothetical protein